MDKTSIEDFMNNVKKALNSIPELPPITLTNARIVGVKLNSDIIESLSKFSSSQEENTGMIYDGIRVYRDDTVNKYRFMVEGDRIVNNQTSEDSNRSEAIECLNYIDNRVGEGITGLEDYIIPKEYFTPIYKALVVISNKEICLDIIINKNVNVGALKERFKKMPFYTYESYLQNYQNYHFVYGEEDELLTKKLTEKEFNLLKEIFQYRSLDKK